MCRHLGYVGRKVTLSSLFHEPPHSLELQSYAAREMLEGHVNADGFGVAWYPGGPSGGTDLPLVGDPHEPLAYRSQRPAWGDPTWNGLAQRLTARIALMNVRNATDPATTGLVSVHPFTRGRWSFTHNGFLTSFRKHFLAPLTKQLSEPRYLERQGASDTETLFLLLLDRLDSGDSPAKALTDLVALCTRLARDADQPTYLNFILSDGERVWATRAGTASRQASLYTAHATKRWPEATLVASEPLDEDELWQTVPPDHLVELTGDEPPRRQPLDS